MNFALHHDRRCEASEEVQDAQVIFEAIAEDEEINDFSKQWEDWEKFEHGVDRWGKIVNAVRVKSGD